MPPKEITRTRLSAASVKIAQPKTGSTKKNPVPISGTAAVLMEATERIGGGPPTISQFAVTDESFTVTLVSGAEELPAQVTAKAGKLTWKLTRLFRFEVDKEHRITATLRGSVTEIHTEVDLPTGRVIRHSSKVKSFNRSDSIEIRVRL